MGLGESQKDLNKCYVCNKDLDWPLHPVFLFDKPEKEGEPFIFRQHYYVCDEHYNMLELGEKVPWD